MTEKEGLIFPNKAENLKRHLKELNLEARSIRKGKLIQSAQQGMPIEDIMKISQHKEVGTLLKYIGFNAEVTKKWENKTKKIRGGREQGPPAKIPRWTKFEDCPSHEDLQKAFPGETSVWQRNRWPVKINKVEPIDVNKLLELDCLNKD
eukprot:Tbor_TRINITY_DN5889_c0_g1::TRINITY_DN5889_c0_g1_i2::g.7300::m.7300